MTEGKEIQTTDEYTIEPAIPSIEEEMETWRIRISELMPLIISYQLTPSRETRDQIVKKFDQCIQTEILLKKAYEAQDPPF